MVTSQLKRKRSADSLPISDDVILCQPSRSKNSKSQHPHMGQDLKRIQKAKANSNHGIYIVTKRSSDTRYIVPTGQWSRNSARHGAVNLLTPKRRRNYGRKPAERSPQPLALPNIASEQPLYPTSHSVNSPTYDSQPSFDIDFNPPDEPQGPARLYNRGSYAAARQQARANVQFQHYAKRARQANHWKTTTLPALLPAFLGYRTRTKCGRVQQQHGPPKGVCECPS
jgi:hypothetical protein